MSGEMDISDILKTGKITTVVAAGTVHTLVELCEKYFKTLGTVPKISIEGDHMAIEVVQIVDMETRRYGTFSQAFDTTNGYQLSAFKPTIYVFRPKGKYGDRSVEASVFHLQDAENADLARCHAAKAGTGGYRLVLKPKPLLLSRTCSNCLNNIVVAQG